MLKKISNIMTLVLLLSLSACSSDATKAQTKPLAAVQNPADLKIVWKGHTGNGNAKTDINFSPAFAEDTLYTVSQNGNMVAYDAKNGRIRWQQKNKTPFSSAPTVGDGKLFVNGDAGELWVFDASNGKKLLSLDLPNKSFSAPAYSNDTVLVKTVDEVTLAFNAEDGALRWRYESDVPDMILEGGSSPVISDDIVVQGSAEGRVTLLTLDKGQLLWQRRLVEPEGISDISRMVDIDADPLVKNGIIYIASYQGKLVALDKFKAMPIWEHDLSTRNDLALTDSALFATDAKGKIWAFDPTTGKVLWRQNNLSGRILTAPVVTGENIVVADNLGNIHWLSQSDGHFVARVQMDKKGISSTPVAAENRVFVMSNQGAVGAYQL